MSTHTIKSYFGKTLDVTLKGDSIHLGCQRGAAEGDAGHLRIYKRDDLLDALGAVSTADMARVIGEAQREANEWKARAEKAEAVIERVRALTVDGDGEWIHRGDLRGALDPKPAFTLPTEAGARFKAVDNCGKRSVFEAVHDGPDIHYLNRRTYVIWSGENVMDYCTDHRLIGADQ